ncbi:MAG: ABC transporter ATP-binding protein [Chloroflexi bacterium RBG_13_48_17]|nr:MAG: ABC transporter ATP-binding protein [Chloroflexi bacterium RBG_13_48_17]
MRTKFAIETKELTKRYGDLVAVDNLNLTIDYGEVFGLLGPNGAGKTTIISMLCTIINPSSGKATVNGFDISRQSSNVRHSIGIVFQDPSIDDRLTGRENLQLHACLYDIPAELAKKRISEVLNLVGLENRADSTMKTYSGGMRRRLELARGLLHHPKVLFLDEPTLGLDPQTREHLWAYIENLARTTEITIVITTHYMEEADKLCNRVAIIDYGKIKVIDTPANLKAALKGDVITITTAQPEKLAARLSELKLTPQIDSSKSIRLAVANAEKLIPKLIKVATEIGIEVSSVSIHHPTLNDVFLHYTGREIRAEEAESQFKKFMTRQRR